jgi:predicted Zn-dependent protease
VTAGVAALAFAGARLAFGNRAGGSDVALDVERGLRPIMRREIGREGTVVSEPAVTGALAAILARLGPNLAPMPLEPELIVVDSPVVNAAALPGGIICVYTGLLRALETPGQLAGVVAHELGHVERRDATTALVRDLGMAAIASAVSGGGQTAAQSLLAAAIDLRYSRAAEQRADRRALELLREADLDPGVFADALEHLAAVTRSTPELLRWFDPHEDVAARVARARAASLPGPHRPLEVDWRAVQSALPSASRP